uniref:Uncharacterized protein AlNc14C24G2457 n=1 Tax=Albugo laibachii Nc14 TaxID=890382 RepID=F0W6F8_9STRA|nr:conserved hypothetical protein [Albugo laibachii Nc14]|eukprot:CCA16702.1 conserved hypothetical protein [Albugo laibachii Nc14]
MAQREQGLYETNTNISYEYIDLIRIHRSKNGVEALQIWHVGLHVERSIDNVWFPAVIIRVDQNETYTLQYQDEGTIETEVPMSEIRSADRRSTFDQLAVRRSVTSQFSESADLAHVVHDDDYECNRQPVVTLHQHGDSSTMSGSYIINGPENNVAAGNGLRGIRWLQVNSR